MAKKITQTQIFQIQFITGGNDNTLPLHRFYSKLGSSR